jgi:hypothetical protein
MEKSLGYAERLLSQNRLRDGPTEHIGWLYGIYGAEDAFAAIISKSVYRKKD